MRFHLLAVAGLLAAVAGAQTGQNVKILHNTQHTDASARVSAGVDTIYYMQPAMSRTGYGRASGWSGVLQDQDYQTSETVQFAYVRYAANGTDPDVGPNGVIANGSLQLNFPQPPQGNVSAALWTITLGTPAAVPSLHGHRLVLPTASQTDGVAIHTQRGQTSQLPASLRKQHTFFLNAQGNAAAFFGAATTLHWGGLYEEPVTQMYTRSSRYGPTEDLLGPEAHLPSQSAGDGVGWVLRSDAFANQIGVLLISGGLVQQPIQTPLGTLFMLPPLGVLQFPFVLDAQGEVKTPTLPAIGGLTLWSQSAFLTIQPGRARFSDATSVRG